MRALVVALVLAGALAGAYLALGGGDYEPTPVAAACARRELPRSGDLLDPVQRATLVVLDGAACDLKTSREELLLTLLDRRRPGRTSEKRLNEALVAGIERAQHDGELSGFEATILRTAVRTAGADAVLRLLRSIAG